MDLITIAERIGVPYRLARYVVDQGIAGAGQRGGRGVPRNLISAEAFRVGLAACLLHAGVKRDLVARLLTASEQRVPQTASMSGNQQSILQLLRNQTIWMEIGDSRFMRFAFAAAANGKQPATPWTELETKKPADPGYQPILTIRIDTKRLASALSEIS